MSRKFEIVKEDDSYDYRIIRLNDGVEVLELSMDIAYNLEELLEIVKREFPGVLHSDVLIRSGTFDPIEVYQKPPSA